MSSLITFNGSSYIIPSTGEVGWGSNVSNYLIAIAAGALQKSGGAFTLSAETDFGAAFGLKALYYKSRGTNVASTGAFRLANAETGVVWRNAANSADLPLTVSASNQLTFNGTPIGGAGIFTASRAIVSDGSGNLASATTTAAEIGYVNGVTSAIQTQLNAKQSSSLASAHILVGNVSNVATDVAVTGDISIDNTGLTAISSGVIVNADINAAAAIAITKIANGTANQLIGTNSGASANEFKTLSGTSNQVTVTNGVGTITLALPQDIATTSAVRFGSLTLGGTLDASAILSLISTTKGFLPPVMTTTERNNIVSPTNGLIVFDSSLAQLYLRSGGVWTPLSTGGGSGTVASGTLNQLAYYGATGTTVSGLTAITASRALVSDTNGLPVAATTTAAEIAFVNGVTSAIQTQLNAKAPLASPTFTGTVTIPTPFTLGATSVTTTGTELNYSVGVTSAIQTQLNNIPDNLVMNGGMDFWTAGTSFGSAPANGSTTADFWNIGYNNTITNVTVSQEASIIDSGTYSAKMLTLDPNTATVLYLQQNIPNFIRLAGYTITLTFRARTNAGSVKAMIIDNNGNSVSSALVANGTFQTLTVSRTLAAGITSLAVRIGYVDAAPQIGTSYFGPAMLSYGAVSEAYTPRPGIIASSQVRGTQTNDSAAVGYVGEVTESTAGPTNFPTTAQYGDLTSISLTAGDWLVSVNAGVSSGTTTTGIIFGISTTSGNSSVGLTNSINTCANTVPTGATSITNFTLAIPSYHMKLASTTTVYLKYSATYAAGTPQGTGRITAVRIR